MATINTLASSLHERVMALTDGHGAEVVVEAVGLADTFVAAVHEVAFGGRVVFIGYAKTPVTFDTSQFVKKELDILGSRNATANDFRAVMTMLRTGSFPVAGAVTRVVGLEDAGEALRDWSAHPSLVTRIRVEFT